MLYPSLKVVSISRLHNSLLSCCKASRTTSSSWLQNRSRSSCHPMLDPPQPLKPTELQSTRLKRSRKIQTQATLVAERSSAATPFRRLPLVPKPAGQAHSASSIYHRRFVTAYTSTLISSAHHAMWTSITRRLRFTDSVCLGSYERTNKYAMKLEATTLRKVPSISWLIGAACTFSWTG